MKPVAEPIALRPLAGGSEFCVYTSPDNRVCKVPRRFSWRTFTSEHAAVAVMDLTLLNERGVIHLPTNLEHNVIYQVGRGHTQKASFVLWQPLLRLNLLRHSHLADPTLRRALTLMLQQSMALAVNGRSIDFAGVGSVPGLLKAILLRRGDVPLHNLHVENDKIVLIDVGLLPISDAGPVGWLNLVLTQIQHAFIQVALADFAAADEAVPTPNQPTAWERLVHWGVRQLYQLVPKVPSKG